MFKFKSEWDFFWELVDTNQNLYFAVRLVPQPASFWNAPKKIDVSLIGFSAKEPETMEDALILLKKKFGK